MKKFILFFIVIFLGGITSAQDFKNQVAAARTAYTAGKLDDAHFSLQQALQELDMIIGKEVLKLLPENMDALKVNPKDDNVTSNIGFVGATIHRSYGAAEKKADLQIISNSPLIASLNTLLNMPILGGMMRDENSKTIKVQGYKARMERSDAGNGKFNYKLDIPFSSALLTFSVDNSSESEITSMASKIPLKEIAQLIQ
ncbi:MAG: hypothetical protein ABI691_18360 [Ginsengibacter sp.]